MLLLYGVNVRLKKLLSIENFYFMKINRWNHILFGENGFDFFYSCYLFPNKQQFRIACGYTGNGWVNVYNIWAPGRAFRSYCAGLNHRPVSAAIPGAELCRFRRPRSKHFVCECPHLLFIYCLYLLCYKIRPFPYLKLTFFRYFYSTWNTSICVRIQPALIVVPR